MICTPNIYGYPFRIIQNYTFNLLYTTVLNMWPSKHYQATFKIDLILISLYIHTYCRAKKYLDKMQYKVHGISAKYVFAQQYRHILYTVYTANHLLKFNLVVYKGLFLCPFQSFLFWWLLLLFWCSHVLHLFWKWPSPSS